MLLLQRLGMYHLLMATYLYILSSFSEVNEFSEIPFVLESRMKVRCREILFIYQSTTGTFWTNNF